MSLDLVTEDRPAPAEPSRPASDPPPARPSQPAPAPDPSAPAASKPRAARPDWRVMLVGAVVDCVVVICMTALAFAGTIPTEAVVAVLASMVAAGVTRRQGNSDGRASGAGASVALVLGLVGTLAAVGSKLGRRGEWPA